MAPAVFFNISTKKLEIDRRTGRTGRIERTFQRNGSNLTPSLENSKQLKINIISLLSISKAIRTARCLSLKLFAPLGVSDYFIYETYQTLF